MKQELKPCPECGGEIALYSCCRIDVNYNYNCFAKCQKCKKEYPMPEVELKTYGTRIYSASVRKAERLWNLRATINAKGLFGL